MEIIVDKNDVRIDSYLSELTDYSRSKIEKLIKNKDITVNDKEVKKSLI